MTAAAPFEYPRGALPWALGVFSLGLGAIQLLQPDAVGRLVGVRTDDTTRTVVRGVGLRELAVVPGLLAGKSPTPWLWARVAGDAMDLALLTGTLQGKDGHDGEARQRTVSAARAVAGIAALDLIAARRAAGRRSLHLTAAITVNCPPRRAYDYWRDLDLLPTFMTHLQSVEQVGNGRSHWAARKPGGGTVRWDAQITDDVPGSRIGWQSVGRTRVPNRGAVRFDPAPGGRGTEVRAHLTYALPGGRAGAAVARLLGEDPHQQVEDDLRRFKQVLETGEVVRSDASPEGTAARRQLLQRPGRPVSS